ncbi:hypothetical protein SGCOL_003112 [Colletotrichum sp. CLE4]
MTRWEDLIDAADQAASAAGDIDEDRTPGFFAAIPAPWIFISDSWRELSSLAIAAGLDPAILQPGHN